MLVFVSIHSLSQQTPPPTITKEDYLKKSKNQKTAAFILLGAGATMIAIAAPGNVSFDILPVLAIGGAGGILGSIPLFIASGKNKKRAMNASAFFDVEKTEMLSHGKIHFCKTPAISLKINF